MNEPVSMPWSAPVFPPPPHSWKGVRSVVMPFTPDPDQLMAVLPPVFEPGEGPGLLTMLSYGWGDNIRIHPFNEAVILVPVRCGGEEGNYVPFIYVNTDEALIPGREAAGWPKKLADISWEREGDRFSGTVTRWGERIIAIEGDIGVEPEDSTQVAALVQAGAKPTFNYKLIPGPGEEIEVEEVTSTALEILPQTVEVGSAKVLSDSSEDDPVATILPSVAAPFVAMVSDNTIPCGSVLRRVDGRVKR